MDIRIEDIEPAPVVGMRAPVRMAEIGETIGRLVPQVLAVAGTHAAGPVISRWHGWDGDGGTMEVAVPVDTPIPGEGDVVASELPGGRAVVHRHVGSYAGLPAAWEAVRAWMGAAGHACTGAPWEAYVSDCDTTPEDELLTLIVWPLEEEA